MPSVTHERREYVSPSPSRQHEQYQEGTLELPLAIPQRTAYDETLGLSTRTISPERSPVWALGLGVGLACSLIMSFWVWYSLLA